MSSFTTLTCAPGIVPPVVSFTMPEIVLVPLWASNATGTSTVAPSKAVARANLMKIICFSPRNAHGLETCVREQNQ